MLFLFAQKLLFSWNEMKSLKLLFPSNLNCVGSCIIILGVALSLPPIFSRPTFMGD